MATTLKALCRQYGYTDSDTEQVELLDLCLRSAIQYAFEADLVPPPEGEEDPMYALLLLMMSVHWYDNRGVTPIGTAPTGQFALGVDAIITTHGPNRTKEDTLADALKYAKREEIG